MGRRKKNKMTFSKIVLAIVIIAIYIVTSFGIPSFSLDKLLPKQEQPISNDLEIYFFDVGQAECILITNKGHNMLIDAGNNVDGPLLVKYLKNELHISKIDYLVGTHPHEDHIGGLDDIINNFTIGKIYMPDVTTTLKTFEDVVKAVEKKKYKITVPKVGEAFKVGDSKATIIYTDTNEEDLNASSIIIRLDYGTTSYLFTGDATQEEEYKFLNQNINVDVLKVAHHGSSKSTTTAFLKKVTPKYAIIQAGKDNDYNHPHTSTLNRIKKYTNNIYVTKDLGTIKITSDGKNIQITNFKTDVDGIEDKK